MANEPILELLKKRRRELGWTQAKLAAKSGVSEMTVGQYERGLRSGSVPTVRALAGAMGLELVLRRRA